MRRPPQHPSGGDSALGLLGLWQLGWKWSRARRRVKGCPGDHRSVSCHLGGDGGGGVEWAGSSTEHTTGACVHRRVHLSE